MIRLITSLVLFSIGFSHLTSSQNYNEIGQFEIINFSPKDYKAKPMCASVIQDNRGVMYFANEGGSVLEYDGSTWQKIDIDNYPVVSIEKNFNGRIIAGTENSIGYLIPDSIGKLRYSPILHAEKEQNKSGPNNKIKIHILEEREVFVTRNKLFIREDNSLDTICTAKNILYSTVVRDTLFLCIEDLGLVFYNNKQLKPLSQNYHFWNKVNSIIRFNNKFLISTKNSIFKGDGLNNTNKIKCFDTNDKRYLFDNEISNMLNVNDDVLSIGTKKGGIVLLDTLGNVIRTINNNAGLLGNAILDQYYSQNGILWLVLPSGISKVNVLSAVKYFDEESGVFGQVQSITRFDDKIYAATNKGLYFMDVKNSIHGLNKFEKDNNVKIAAWDLCTFYHCSDSLLVMALDNGVYTLDKNGIVQKVHSCNPWCVYQSDRNPEKLFVGLDSRKGIVVFNREDGNWKLEYKSIDAIATVRIITEDSIGNIWLGTSGDGIIKLDPFDYSITAKFDTLNGLPGGFAHMSKTISGMKLFAERGVHVIDEIANRVYKDPNFSKSLLNDRYIHRVAEDYNNNLWIETHREMTFNGKLIGLCDLEFFKYKNGNYENTITLMSGSNDRGLLHTIYPEKNGTIWFGGDDGVFQYNSTLNILDSINPKPLIRKVILNNDSLVFDGAFSDSKANVFSDQTLKDVLCINEGMYYLEINFSSLDYHQDLVRYSYMLEGFEEEWSKWNIASEIKYDYVEFLAGTYTFKVRAKNKYNNISDIATYKIIVYAPWYKDTRAGIIFFFSIILLVIFFNYRRSRRLEIKKEIEEKNEELSQQKEELLSTIDELRKTQSQLVESEKMASLGELVAGVAHEINTPVGIGITASSALLDKTTEIVKRYKSGKIKKSELEAYFNMAYNSSKLLFSNLERTGELVQSFKQVSVDQSTDQLREFNLKSYFQDVLRSLAPKLKHTNIDLVLECPEDIVINSYPGPFAQIITNLVNNSLIHAFTVGQEGQISINAEKQNEKLLIEYADNGKGMTDEVKTRIFDPFFTTNKQEGTGLGMHIIFNLVTQKLKGQISIDNQTEKGIIVKIHLPI